MSWSEIAGLLLVVGMGFFMVFSGDEKSHDGVLIPNNVYIGQPGDLLSRWSAESKMLDGEEILYVTHISDRYGTLRGVYEENHRYFILTNKRFLKVTAGIIETAIRLTKFTRATANDDTIIFSTEIDDTGEVNSISVKMFISQSKISFYINEIKKIQSKL